MPRAFFPLLAIALFLFGSTRLSAQTPPGKNDGEKKQAPRTRSRSRQRKSPLPTSSKRLK